MSVDGPTSGNGSGRPDPDDDVVDAEMVPIGHEDDGGDELDAGTGDPGDAEPFDDELSGDESLGDEEAVEDAEVDGAAVDGDDHPVRSGRSARRAARAAKRTAVPPDEPKRPNVLVRLFRGGTSFDFIGKRKIWFTVSAIVIVAGVISLATRGLNESIDFRGGQSWTISSQTLTVQQATQAAESVGVSQPTVIELTNQLTGKKQIEVQADLNSLSQTQQQDVNVKMQEALGKAAHEPGATVSFDSVGPTWGGQVTSKAIEALIIFFIAVVIYISIRFEFKMAIAALVAVFHDLLVTLGIYSLTGFQVSPDTVVAVLTVLGYSLYDTVVVFDRIGDNAKGLGASGRITYSDMVNLSMNQTLARSINTSLVAVIPVLSVLLIGSYVLGATTMEDFGLALVIGLTSGAYSSIFIASPLLAVMKEREPRYVTIRQRLEARGDRIDVLTPASVAAMGGGVAAVRSGRSKTTGVLRPGAAAAARAEARRSGGSKEQAGNGDEPVTVGAGTAGKPGVLKPGAARGGGGASGARSAARPARPGGARPGPRPRKGKGKGKGKRH